MERCIKIREAYYAGQDQFVCPHEGCDETLRIRAVPPREHLLTCASHGRILHCEL
jgi:nitrite reductase/ring-hydroxylating ferredoxin subunit